MFFENANAKSQNCEDGVTRKILATGGALMLTEVRFAKGAAGAMHRHPHEQVSYIASGAFQFTLNGVHQVLKQGDSVYIPSNAEHGVLALEEQSVIVDVFTPIREDFLR